eukprot:356178-Chlamydomonas_euryale.AAC.5
MVRRLSLLLETPGRRYLLVQRSWVRFLRPSPVPFPALVPSFPFRTWRSLRWAEAEPSRVVIPHTHTPGHNCMVEESESVKELQVAHPRRPIHPPERWSGTASTRAALKHATRSGRDARKHKAQPPLAEWTRRGQPAHNPPQRPLGAEGKDQESMRLNLSGV